MNTHGRAIYSLLAVTLVAGCVPLEQHSARFEKKWPATTIARLDVHEIDGTISVDGNSPGEITMVAVVHARGVRPDPQKEYQGYFRTELDGDTLTVAFAPSASFKRTQAEDPKNVAMLRDALYEITGRKLTIEFVVGDGDDGDELSLEEPAGEEHFLELMKETFDARERDTE